MTESPQCTFRVGREKERDRMNREYKEESQQKESLVLACIQSKYEATRV